MSIYDNPLGYTLKGLMLDTELSEESRSELADKLLVELLARIQPLAGFAPEEAEQLLDLAASHFLPKMLARSAHNSPSSN